MGLPQCVCNKERFVKIIAAALVVILVVLLLPLFKLAMYDVPGTDDYSYGTTTHLILMNGGSLKDVVAEAFAGVANTYNVWQGSFTAIFLMMMQPAIFGEEYYYIGAVLILLSLSAATFSVCLAFFHDAMKQSKSFAVIIAAVCVMLNTQLIPSPVQGIYWFNGAVYYTFYYALTLFACAGGIRLALHGGKCRCVCLCLLAAFIGGGNYITGLALCELAAAAIFMLYIARGKNRQMLIAPAVTLLIAFAINIAAPGNMVRQAETENIPNAVKAIMDSFKFAAEYGTEWFSLPVVGAVIALSVLFFCMMNTEKMQFPLPLLVSAASFCFFASMFCPTAYALGIAGDPRVLNIIFFAYILLVAMNCFWWIGWLRVKMKSDINDKQSMLPVIAGAMVCAVFFGAYVVKGGSLCSAAALASLRSGEAREYYECAQQRYELLLDESKDVVLLEPYPSQPWLLYYEDITEDPGDWRNQSVRRFYGKLSVAVGYEEDTE